MANVEHISAAGTLRLNKERVLKLWEERARQELSSAQSKAGFALRDHLPKLLDNIIVALSPDKPAPPQTEQKSLGVEHGRGRADFGDYSLEQTLSEYSILRKSIFEVLEVELKRPLAGIERDIILDCLSLATIGSAEEFSDRGKEKLRESNEDLQRFAFIASHDLQEPLRMITTYIRLIERELADKLDQNIQQYFAFVTGGANRMNLLINSLLDYARIGAECDQRQQADLNVALKEATQNLEVLIKEGGASISAGALPTAKGSLTAYCLLFQNLLSNAIKYRSQRAPEITVSASVNGDRCVVSVADNGIGIAPENREKIFTLFSRLHSRSQYPGVGIGLGLCRRIMKFYGGSIWVEPNPAGGSVFRFEISTV